MGTLLVMPILVLACGQSLAQEVGLVISSVAIIQQVAVPRQVCITEAVAVQAPKSGAGAVLGALAGGAIGHAVGAGGGRAAATMLGVFGGAVMGDRVEAAGTVAFQNVQRCEMQTLYENRSVGYRVVYEYAGKHYTAQMPQDPGPTLPLQVAPAGTLVQAPVIVGPEAVAQQDPLRSATDIAAAPVYTGYYAPPYYPPIALQFGLGFGGGHRYRY